MGLNAVVYVNRDDLELNDIGRLAQTDRHTGEVYFEDLNLTRKFPGIIFTAINKRLGNIDLITQLRDEILNCVSHSSVLYSRVLYDGSHSGDNISLEDVNSLESEIKLIRDKTAENISPALRTFLSDMSELIETAKEQRNPIVFV